MKVSNPRGEQSQRAVTRQHSYPFAPPPDFELLVADARQKWGFFEYSDALPRAETAEATGPFRDQGLTPSWTSGVGCGALAVSIAPYAGGNVLAHHRHSRR